MMNPPAEERFQDALRRVIDVADVTEGPVDPTKIHDAIGHDIILELMYRQRAIPGAGQATLFLEEATRWKD